MQFKLSTIVAFLLLFLTGHSLAYNSCYTGGMKWSNLGTEAEIDGALADLCAMFEGAKPIHYTAHYCINLNGNHIFSKIKITDGPADSVFLDSLACVSLILKVRQKCFFDFGGELEGMKTTNSEAHGGQLFTATVRADPQSGHGSSCLGD